MCAFVCCLCLLVSCVFALVGCCLRLCLSLCLFLGACCVRLLFVCEVVFVIVFVVCVYCCCWGVVGVECVCCNVHVGVVRVGVRCCCCLCILI